MHRWSWLGIAGFATAVLVGIAAPAAAASAVDQEVSDDGIHALSAFATTGVAQVFTAGRTGLLDRVDVSLKSAGGGDLLLQLTEVSGTDPSDVLASGALSGDNLDPTTPEWVPVHFDTPASVTSGTQYAIVLRSAGGAANWMVDNSSTYGAGFPRVDHSGSWVGVTPSTADMGFRTYVGTPFDVGPAASITGTVRQGQTLTAHAGSPDPTPDSFAYKWFADGTEIAGATGSTFTLTSAQVGSRITVEVTAQKSGLIDASDTSNPTTPVRGIFDPGPHAFITGTARIGATLSAHPGSTSPSPEKRSYRWFADGKPISSATASTLKLGTAQVGKRIAVRVYIAKTGYLTANDLSNLTSKVSGLRAKRLSLDPDEDTVRVGQTVTPVYIRGLASKENWTLYFDGHTLKSGNADTDGKVKTSYIVPSVPKGKHVLKVTGRFTDRYDTDTLTVK